MSRPNPSKNIQRIKRFLWCVLHPKRFLDSRSQRPAVCFLLNEIQRTNESLRWIQLRSPDVGRTHDSMQTRASFDYQWRHLTSGAALPTDSAFVESAPDLICEWTGLPREWFPGKRVLDLGAGTGRFTHGLLRLGAQVTASDQSASGLERTAELCKKWSDSLTLLREDILDWSDEGNFDLVFCFGVVHHTGNTYLAIRNAAAKVRPDGRLFLMVYGYPRSVRGMRELNLYEALREETRDLSFERRAELLLGRFGPDLAHGYFDAVSPRINDLLSFDEIRELLHSLSFESVQRTRGGRNHFLVADKRLPDAHAIGGS